MSAMSAATTSTSMPLFSRPQSPVKVDLKPNPHPYAIKTTSTGALSRSNSSPHNSQSAAYHYVPPSPSRNAKRPVHAGGHRYSKSFSGDSPSPLPFPPTSPTRQNVTDDDGEYPTTQPNRNQRSDTLPSSVSSPLDDLPTNPKSWTASQLSTYLASALRLKSGETLELPAAVAKDIALFVRESKITGKSFLRFNEEDLEAMSINKLWREALLSASRSLRQNILRGRIWGFGHTVESETEGTEPNPNQATPGRHRSTRSLSNADESFAGALYSSSSSSSSVDLSVLASAHAQPRYRNGRVKGMVASFERSASVEDDERSVGSASSSSSFYTAHKRHSASLNGSDDDGFATALGSEVASPSQSHSRSGSQDGIFVLEEEAAARDYPTERPRSRPLPTPPITTIGYPSDAESEPSMEALLRDSGVATGPSQGHGAPPTADRRTWEEGSRGRRGGVHAWEDEEGLGVVTVKHIGNGSPSASAEARAVESVLEEPLANDRGDAGPAPKGVNVGVLDKSHRGMGDFGARAKTRGKKEGRRIVTAIFAPEPTNDEAVDQDGAAPPAPLADQAISCQPTEFPKQLKQNSTHSHATEEKAQAEDPDLELQSQFSNTQSLLEMFRYRLEEVERKVGEMEVEDHERQKREREEEDQRAREAAAAAEVARRIEEERRKASLEQVPEAVETHRGRHMRSLSSLSLLRPTALLTRIVELMYGTSASSVGRHTSYAYACTSLAPAPPVGGYPAITRSPLNGNATSGHVSSSSTTSNRRTRRRSEALGPTTLSGLPPYILLVSIGVCAVVLRVVMARVAGRRARGA